MKNDCCPAAATGRLLRSARRHTMGLSAARRALAGCLMVAGLLTGVAQSGHAAETLDLSNAVVVVPKGLAGPEAQAVRMLVEEVEKRSQLRWPATDAWPDKAGAVILVGPSRFANDVLAQHQVSESRRFDAPEGYRLRVVDAKPPIVMVAGNDSRGVLFGVGRLLRELRISRRRVLVPGVLEHRQRTEVSPAWSSARLSPQDQFVRRLDGADVGAIHPRSGGLRHQRG